MPALFTPSRKGRDLGLLPVLSETSMQAQLIIPMACSLCFGLSLSTILVLLIVLQAVLTIISSVFWKLSGRDKKVAGKLDDMLKEWDETES